MKKKISGLLKLSRFEEFANFIIITSLLSLAATKQPMDWRILTLIPANWLAVGFAFMISNIADAPEDALSSKRFNQNPISSGLLTPPTAKKASLIIGLLAAGLFAILGLWSFLLGLFNLILDFLYSARGIRLKKVPILNILLYGFMFGGLQFLVGVLTFKEKINSNWFWPFFFIISISIMNEAYNKIREYNGKPQSKRRHLATISGEKTAYIGLFVSLAAASFSGIFTFVINELLPMWVILVMAVLAILLILPHLFTRSRTQRQRESKGVLQKTIELAAALALILQHLVPWINQLFNLKLFK